jgi:DNA-binding GntR family transcriptional regulator
MRKGSRLEVDKLNVLPLREQIYSHIKQLILTNQFYPGQTVVIDQLVKSLGVSHTPIREALMLLESEGLVITGRYKSVRIAPINESDVRDIYEMRILLEGWAVHEATLLLKESDIAGLEQVLEEAKSLSNDSQVPYYLDLDIRFHNSIIDRSPNKVFGHIMDQLKDQAERVRSLVEAAHTPNIEATIINEHVAILEAIKQRDPDLAQEKMIYHLRSAMQRTLDALKRMNTFRSVEGSFPLSQQR